MKYLVFLYATLVQLIVLAQTPIAVVDRTFTLDSNKMEEEIYCGFATGDIIILNVKELKGKTISSIQVQEYNSAVSYEEQNVKKIENKKLEVAQEAIYKFTLRNLSHKLRIYKIEIYRIPASEKTKKFNTTVYWNEQKDSTLSHIKEINVVRKDTSIVNLVDQTTKVHSNSNINGNKQNIKFSLPENTIAWSYYIGVDQAGQEAFETGVKQMARSSSKILMHIPEYGPMAALALTGISFIPDIQTGEDIDYFLLTAENFYKYQAKKDFNYLKKGKILNVSGRMVAPTTGTLFIQLENDNLINGVNVTVLVTAITVTETRESIFIEEYKHFTKQIPFLKY